MIRRFFKDKKKLTSIYFFFRKKFLVLESATELVLNIRRTWTSRVNIVIFMRMWRCIMRTCTVVLLAQYRCDITSRMVHMLRATLVIFDNVNSAMSTISIIIWFTIDCRSLPTLQKSGKIITEELYHNLIDLP